MAYLYRLIVLCVGLCVVQLSYAAFPASPSRIYNAASPNYGYTASTPEAACSAWAAADNEGKTLAGTTGPDGGGGGTCIFNRPSTTQDIRNYTSTPGPLVCPANSTLSGSSCTCNANFDQSGSSCVARVDPADAHCASIVGSPVKTSWSSTAPSLATRTVCSSGGYGYYSCNATVEPDYCGSADGVTYVCYGSGTSAGGACTPSPSPEQPVPPTEPVSEFPSPPPPGTCPGQVNGVTVNVPCNNSVSKGTKNEASNDGAGNTSTKAESRSTTCTAAGACSTTVTTVTSLNGGAPVTSTKTVEQSKGGFCEENPSAKECGDGEGSSFGGSCDSGFVCEGDAVQCAHAKETHLQNCKLNKDTPERQLYEASKGDDAEFDNDEVVNVGPSSFSQAPILGAASCISDKSITVMGSSVSLPFSRVCEYLAMLGNVLMAVGFLLSGRIIMRG